MVGCRSIETCLDVGIGGDSRRWTTAAGGVFGTVVIETLERGLLAIEGRFVRSVAASEPIKGLGSDHPRRRTQRGVDGTRGVARELPHKPSYRGHHPSCSGAQHPSRLALDPLSFVP